MQHLPTAMLRHSTRTSSHYDWLLADPRDPMGLLWTARTMASSDTWTTRGSWTLEPIAPHRRIYLDYQGAISGARGTVLRVDRGWFVPRMWTGGRIIIELQFTQCAGVVEMRQVSPTCWTARMDSCAVSQLETDECRAADED